MNTEEYLEDVDDPGTEASEQNLCVQVNSGTEEIIGVVNINSDDFVKCSEGIITFQDGSQWYKIPVTLAEGNDQDVVEEWNSIEGQKIEVKVEDTLEESGETEKEAIDAGTTVAADVIVLEDGTVAYITQPASNFPEAKVEREEENKKSGNNKKKNKSHYCTEPGCERSYSSLHHLKVHVRNHTGDRPFKCTIEGCDKAFATDYSRKAHLRTHTGEKPYPCTRCNKSFKTSGDLQKHVRTHTGERPFICPVEGCNRSFTTSNIRKVHIRTHTGERPYICKFENCKRSFASSTNHKNHMRIHSGEKPFCCPVSNCMKRFTEYSSLYKHQLVHSQVKRYKCQFCYKVYRQMSTLTTHKRTVHGVISAEDGTEIILEQMITSDGKDGLKNFKNIAINLLNLKKDRNTYIQTLDEDEPVYIVTEQNSDTSVQFDEDI
ncbi:hypothetical protein O3M35_006825 [Rhynocoris fuscipes]|uniref:C2H2-type domain-containing protein n=1 Tax=Rhynocoris fuscipes TaxID=488301 RepID=A0AAW1DER2_9HEMI